MDALEMLYNSLQATVSSATRDMANQQRHHHVNTMVSIFGDDGAAQKQ
jgi:hypothetical protein